MNVQKTQNISFGYGLNITGFKLTHEVKLRRALEPLLKGNLDISVDATMSKGYRYAEIAITGGETPNLATVSTASEIKLKTINGMRAFINKIKHTINDDIEFAKTYPTIVRRNFEFKKEPLTLFSILPASKV